jgi:hypothetical protein
MEWGRVHNYILYFYRDRWESPGRLTAALSPPSGPSWSPTSRADVMSRQAFERGVARERVGDDIIEILSSYRPSRHGSAGSDLQLPVSPTSGSLHLLGNDINPFPTKVICTRLDGKGTPPRTHRFSMSCPDCFKGHAHDGAPTGKVEILHGLHTYIAEPSAGTQAEAIVIIVPDALGWEFVNNRLLADHYAVSGNFLVYLPDFMDGQSAPQWLMVS